MDVEQNSTCENAGAASSGWWVYLLECADGTFYCGVATDLTRRLAEHNGELPGGARYTRPRRPVRLVASHPCPDRATASRLEWRVKQLKRSKKVKFFSGLGSEGTEGE